MISAINLNNIKYINFKTNAIKPRYNISFKGDFFESKIKSVFGTLDESAISDIKCTIDKNQKLGSGFTSNIFKHNDLIVKSPKISAIGETLSEQATTQNLKEFFALKEIEKINPDIATKAHDVLEHKGLFYLVEDFVDGIHPHKSQIKDSHIKDLLSKFLQLDKNGLANCDLQSGNIFLLNNGKTKLIDFGSFSILNNEGYASASDYIPGKLFKQNQEFLQYINKPIKEKLAKTFFNPTADDIKNLSDNPYLNIMSNTSNFEFRTLYKHLLSGNESNPLEFFRNYIKNKGEIYHGNMEEFLKSIDIDKVVLTSDKKEAAEVAKTGLKKAINYENLAKQVFENPTDEVLKTELGKIQLKTFLNPDTLGSPIPNSKKLQSAYTQLTSLLQSNIENSQGSQKEYYTETLKCLENRFKNFRFEAGQVDIPENENLIIKLFEKIKPEDKIDDIVNTVKKNNKKMYLFIAAGLALIGIGGVCLYKKKKAKLPNTNNTQPYAFANNAIAQGFNVNKTTSNIFADFNK